MYAKLLGNIAQVLVKAQQQQGTKLVWVRTTPVPTVPVYDGKTCNVTSQCLNPPRYDSDVRLYNQAADQVMQQMQAAGAVIHQIDLYSFVLKQCGGQGYKSCPGFQLPMFEHQRRRRKKEEERKK